MTDWKNKLLAFLHDPPHKPFRIAGHEDARGPLLRHVGLSEEEIRDWNHQPDWWAAAADRFPFPRAEVLNVDWKEDGKLEFRHPLAGNKFIPPNQPRPGATVGESWLEDILHGLPVDGAGWREKFFRLWRCWPERAAREKNPLLAYLVADTRIPDHTLWHHNGLVSALEATEAKPAFLLFQIGPVQDFIAQARKTQDLWSGSYLLSFLISKALATLSLTVGPDAIIYPSLRGAPLLDWWWSQERGLFPEGVFRLGRGRLHANELLTPGLPNRFLALVPGGHAGRGLAEELEKQVRDVWQKIAHAVHADICTKLQDHVKNDQFPGWDAFWQKQVARFPTIDWTVHDWLPESRTVAEAAKGTPPFAGGWTQSALHSAIAWRNMILTEHQESWHGTRNDAFAWPLHYATTDWELAARKNARGFAQWPTLDSNASSPPKDHLNGRDEVLGGSSPDAFWAALRAAYGGVETGHFKGRQLYGAISVIKRLWPAAFLRDNLGWSDWKPRFDSVQNIALAIDSEPNEALATQDPKYYAILIMDGDDMGQWVSGARTPLLRNALSDKAWKYFAEGKEGKGGWSLSQEQRSMGLTQSAEEVHRPLSPGFHAALSEALGNFGLYCAGQVVEAFGGQLLYSGGDDVLAMLPAGSVLDCAMALQCAFRGELPSDSPRCVREKLNQLFKFDPDAPGFLCCQRSGKDEALRPNWPLMVPGDRATASVGIAIGHVRSPMQDTIQAARNAEAAAKQVPGKGAFCLSILKRSGEAVHFTAQFKTGVSNVWADLNDGSHSLSGRFAYRFLQIVRPLLARAGKDGDAGWERQWSGELLESVEAELRHVCYQQNESNESAERKRATARDLAAHWMQELVGNAADAGGTEFQPALAPRDFIHFWMAWAFVRRLGESKGEQ